MEYFYAPIRAAKLPVCGAPGLIGHPAVFLVGEAREPDTGEEVIYKHLLVLTIKYLILLLLIKKEYSYTVIKFTFTLPRWFKT